MMIWGRPGAEPMFGTHPIAWAAPSGDEENFLFDVSCCQVAANKVTLARRLKVKLAANWVRLILMIVLIQ